MLIEDFFDKVLANDGHYCVWARQANKNKIFQRFFADKEEFIHTTETLDGRGFDVYYALATFTDANSRVAEESLSMRSFFLDIDCGEGKDYDSQEDALDALSEFCEELLLPEPVKINSGRGVHVYWFLSEGVPTQDWVPVANRLKAKCSELGFRADPSVTSDAARVLRVPYTHNYKGKKRAPVEFIGTPTTDTIEFSKFSTMVGGPLASPSSGRSNKVMDALLGNRQNSFKDIIVKTSKGVGCEQLRQVWQEQDTCSEPLWRAGLSIAKFCTDSEVAARNISKHHPDYTLDATLAKMQGIKGPYTCDSFDEFNPGVCGDCKHRGKIKSPIVLGGSYKEAKPEDNKVVLPEAAVPNAPLKTYTIPEYPKPFFRGENGGVYVRTRNSEGDPEERMIYHNDLYVVKRIRDVEAGEGIVVRLHLPKDGVIEFTVPLTAVTSREELRKHMAMRGVAVPKIDEVMNYMTTWVNNLQATSTADVARRQFGWTDDDCTSFVIGGKEITATEIKDNPPSTPTAGLFHAFEPRGTLQEWVDMANFYAQDKFEMHQYVVGTAFGSPLMALTPIACLGLHIHCKESGAGKTTAIKVASGVWGQPEELVLNPKDTNNSAMNRNELYQNLPMYIDELTNLHGKVLSDTVYALSGGRQKNRLSNTGQNVERTRGRPWRLLSVTTGNTSMIEKISGWKDAPQAEAQRMMECKAVKLFTGEKSTTDIHATNSTTVYGHAGPIYIQYVIQNIGEVQTLLNEVQDRIDRMADLRAENRFWSAGIACTLTGVIIANRLGLLDYNVEKLFKFAIGLIKSNQTITEDLSSPVADTLNGFITEHWGNILKIQSTDDLRSNNGTGDSEGEAIVIPDVDPRAKLVGRYETDLKHLYLVPKQVRTWCIANQINYNSFVDDLVKDFNAKRTKKSITKGTTTRLAPSHLLFVDCSKSPVGVEPNDADI